MSTDCKFQFIVNRCRPLPYQVSKHLHDCYEIVYYISGRGISQIDGVDHPYEDGTFCIIPPNVYHAETPLSQTDLICIGFDLNKEDQPFPIKMYTDKDGSVLSIMNSLKTELATNSIHFDEMIEIEVKRLVLTLLRISSNDTKSYKNKNAQNLLNFAVQYIERNYMDDIDLTDLAASVGYSYHRFRHLFSQIYNTTPTQFIQTVRIRKAKEMLLSTNDSVENIARACGFRFCTHFIAVFKSETGETPLQYRKRNRID